MSTCWLDRNQRQPLDCLFLQQQRDWLALTRHWLDDEDDVVWHCGTPVTLATAPPAVARLVLVEVEPTALDSLLPAIYNMYRQGTCVIVAGDSHLVPVRLPLRMAGASLIVTSSRQCPGIARIIRRFRDCQPWRPVEWHTQIERRLPWRSRIPGPDRKPEFS